MRWTLAAAILAAACAGEPTTGPDPTVDAAPDAPPPAIEEVSCTGVTPVETITTAGGEYFPSTTTVAVGDVVKFELSAGHTAHSFDDLFEIDQGAFACLRVNAAGEHRFYCAVHGFTGSIVAE